MKLAQQGNSLVYHDLLSDVTSLLRGYVSNRILGQDDVEDVVQEILISLHRARHTYHASRPFKPWLFAIARYRLNDYLRGVYASREKEKMAQEYAIIQQNSYETDVTESYENYELLKKVIEDLPQRQQKIITLMKLEGWTAVEVASELGMSESAVKVAAHRAYKAIRRKLDKND